MNDKDVLRVVAELNKKLTPVMQDHIDNRLLEMEQRQIELLDKKDKIVHKKIEEYIDQKIKEK